MRILAIESSALVASVAILENETIIAEYTTNFKKTHSQTLLPMIDEIFCMTNCEKASIDCIAVANGPGSFTGLRIGAATAKGLAQAWNIPIAEISTLQAMAAQFYDTNCLISPIMDARRAQVYTALYKVEQGALVEIEKEQAISMDEWMEKLLTYHQTVVFLGDGVPVFATAICEVMGEKARLAPAHLARQRAGAVAYLGAKAFAKGETVMAQEHAPVYLRKSQAEREKEEHEQRTLEH